MTSEFGNLSGPGTQQVWINVYRESQTGNQSNYRAIGRYYGNGYGSYNNDVDQYWSANLGGYVISGAWRITQAARYDTYTELFNVTFSRAHDAAGYGSGFTSTMSIDTSHSSIGDGSVSVSEETPPRIPKAPSAPGIPTLSDITTRSMKAAWSAPSDDGGQPILEYEVQYSTNPSMAGASAVSSGTARERTLNDLPPGTDQTVRVRARNSVGWGAPSATRTARTKSGIRVPVGGTWVSGEVRVPVGGSWVAAADVRVPNGSGGWVSAG